MHVTPKHEAGTISKLL